MDSWGFDDLPVFDNDDRFGYYDLDGFTVLDNRTEYPIPIFTTPPIVEDKCQKKTVKARPKRIFKPFFTGFVDQLTVKELNEVMRKISMKKFQEVFENY